MKTCRRLLLVSEPIDHILRLAFQRMKSTVHFFNLVFRQRCRGSTLYPLSSPF